jgi:hypothetical protein
MRLRPAHIIPVLITALSALGACGSDDSVGPPPVQPAPAWSEITNFPANVTLYGVWAPRADYIMGVGRGGRVWQWDGVQWSNLPNTYPADLYAIDGSTSGKVIAVGAGGIVLEQTSSSFTRRDIGLSNNLHDVWRSPSGKFIAVGDYGTVVSGTGTAWSADSTATHSPLLSVWGSSDSDVFATGVDGVILHYDGDAWSAMTSGTSQILASVSGNSATDVYAAGASGTILHYDGDHWSELESHTTDFLQSVCAECGPAAAGTNGSVVRMSGGVFTHEQVAGAPWLYAMTRAGEDQWVIGDNALFRYDGAAWDTDARGTIPVMRAMTSNSSLGLVTVGDNGIAMMDGPSHWSLQDVGALQRLNAVYTTAAGDVYAAGTNRIFHYTNQGWETENNSNVEFFDIGGDDDHLFAVGTNSTILEHQSNGWQTVVLTPGEDFHAICMTDESDTKGYIVGSNGNILYYDNNPETQRAAWAVHYTRPGATLWDITPVSTREYRAIAIGTNGLSLGRSTRRGVGWETIQTPVTTTLYSLARGPAGYLYAAGSGGTLMRLVDEKWSIVPAPTTRNFIKAWSRDGALFLCGGSSPAGGMLFRYGPPNP